MSKPAKLTADEALAQMAQNVVEYISAERPTVFCDHSRWHAALSSELAALREQAKMTCECWREEREALRLRVKELEDELTARLTATKEGP